MLFYVYLLFSIAIYFVVGFTTAEVLINYFIFIFGLGHRNRRHVKVPFDGGHNTLFIVLMITWPIGLFVFVWISVYNRIVLMIDDIIDQYFKRK